ncbi:hypothetical protein [Caldibacillus thermoamylovorans]|uniref:hypothetical protein n=1 Tax=Caldibacillus thermoamylovorans TaxID=35841 RepID=UPI0012601E49|nr:hypothetical protein [Caldibacillus thermoamylovorans]
MTTRTLLVVFLSSEIAFFSDETTSRRRFEPENLPFWRRDLFSSPVWGGKLHFLTTRSVLVVIAFFG